jgi:preprotein translocase subunit SecE
MAKNKKTRKRPSPESSASSIATAAGEPEEERFGPDDGGEQGGGSEGFDGTNGGSGYSGHGGTPSSAPGGGFFDIYKSGQGYFTRLGTGIGVGLIAVFGANYVHSQITSSVPAVQLGVPAVILALAALALWWVVGSGRKTNDFFIATEGEMKKVSWSTRTEVIGSTKVVLAFTLMMATMLFFVDGLFMAFFGYIGVLKGSILETLFGL